MQYLLIEVETRKSHIVPVYGHVFRIDRSCRTRKKFGNSGVRETDGMDELHTLLTIEALRRATPEGLSTDAAQTECKQIDPLQKMPIFFN
jgi:hypothetical protein